MVRPGFFNLRFTIFLACPIEAAFPITLKSQEE
jgi:hypothetical protein